MNDISNMSTLDLLPDEVLSYVVSFLEVPDLFNCLLVCRRLHRLATDPTLLHKRLSCAARWLDYSGAATTCRPSPTTLARRNILLSPARLAPSADPSRTRLLQTIQRRLHRDTLARLLATRPSVKDLVNRNIVPNSRVLDCGPLTAQTVAALERQRRAHSLATFFAANGDKSPRKPAALIVIVHSTSSSSSLSSSSSFSPQISYNQPFTPESDTELQQPKEYLLLRRPVSALVHMFACTAMWLTAPPPPPPPPLPGSEVPVLNSDHHNRVPQICSLFEQAEVSRSSHTSSSILDELPCSPGRVAMLRQLFV